MDITLKRDTHYVPFYRGLRAQMMGAFAVIVAVVLVLMNSYPLILSRQMIFNTKEQSLKAQAAIIGKSLSSIGTISADNVTQTLSMLDLSGLGRIIVTDARGNWLYESISGDLQPEKGTIDWCVSGALDGQDCVEIKLLSGVFYSSVSLPIIPEKLVTGCVYIFEADSTQGEILSGLRTTMLKISVAVSIGALIISLLLSGATTKRLRRIHEGIRQVRKGDYSYRVKLYGKDEVAQLGGAFNSLAERLQKTEEVRRRFVSDASHELKTPLAAIRLLSDSIVQNPEIDTVTAREFVSDIGSEAERLARITDKLLKLTRLDNRLDAVKEEVDVNAVINSTLRILAPLAEEKNVLVILNAKECGAILASKDDIYQIIFNLVENAIKYNVPGGGVEIISRRSSNHAVVTVRDTGIGVPEKDMAYIFDRFYRVDKARSREAGGSGLGLSIVRDLVRGMDGEIDVKRRKEAGMEFTVRFPLFKSAR